MTNEQTQQNAGKYETALYDCENILAELRRLKIKVGKLGLEVCYDRIDKAEDMVDLVYKNLYELQ